MTQARHSPPLGGAPERIGLVLDRLREGASVQDCNEVLAVYEAVARYDPERARWFNGETHWRPANFKRALGMSIRNAPSARASPTRTRGRDLSARDWLERARELEKQEAGEEAAREAQRGG